MAHRATTEARRTFLVEHYRTGARVEELRGSASRVRDTVAQMKREGAQVGFLSSTIVPGDEYFHCVVEAASEQLVRGAFARAGIPFERISPAISVEAEDRPESRPSQATTSGPLPLATAITSTPQTRAEEER